MYKFHEEIRLFQGSNFCKALAYVPFAEFKHFMYSVKESDK